MVLNIHTMPSDKQHFSYPVRVYIEDTDAGGIVYYVNYLKYMERARTEWLRHLGFDFQQLLALDCLMVVANADIKYHQSARMDDPLLVSVVIEKVGKASIVFYQAVTTQKADQAEPILLSDARIKVGCISQSKHKARLFPADMAAALRLIVS